MKKFAVLTIAVALVAAGIGFGTSSASAATPVAHPGGPYAALVGQPIQFNGSGSAAVGGVIAYAWSFGDGTSAAGGFPVKAYAAPGIYTVTLTVQDASGAVASATTTATIGAVAPSVVSGGCVWTSAGTIVCTTLTPFGTLAPFGCVLTIFGWSCPGRIVVLQPPAVGIAVDPAICAPTPVSFPLIRRRC